ncbi:hypothetical protein [Fusibacter sp. JL216-2]|uniref:hypothetical protein n=1 Tax=Fusibacter sp. JL216-2 TaxID=3071453 RepID=UPI003D353FA6
MAIGTYKKIKVKARSAVEISIPWVLMVPDIEMEGIVDASKSVFYGMDLLDTKAKKNKVSTMPPSKTIAEMRKICMQSKDTRIIVEDFYGLERDCLASEEGFFTFSTIEIFKKFCVVPFVVLEPAIGGAEDIDILVIRSRSFRQATSEFRLCDLITPRDIIHEEIAKHVDLDFTHMILKRGKEPFPKLERLENDLEIDKETSQKVWASMIQDPRLFDE